MAKSRSSRSSGVSASGGGAGGTSRPSNSRGGISAEDAASLNQMNMGVDLGAAGRALKGIGRGIRDLFAGDGAAPRPERQRASAKIDWSKDGQYSIGVSPSGRAVEITRQGPKSYVARVERGPEQKFESLRSAKSWATRELNPPKATRPRKTRSAPATGGVSRPSTPVRIRPD